ncbi:hypothetical protein V8E36_002628 [Tilletia maclaganii]
MVGQKACPAPECANSHPDGFLDLGSHIQHWHSSGKASRLTPEQLLSIGRMECPTCLKYFCRARDGTINDHICVCARCNTDLGRGRCAHICPAAPTPTAGPAPAPATAATQDSQDSADEADVAALLAAPPPAGPLTTPPRAPGPV